MSDSLREWSGEPNAYDHFAEEPRPSRIKHSFFLHLPVNQETMEFDAKQRELWKLLDDARSEMPRNFDKIIEIQNNINTHLIQYDEPTLKFPQLKRTFRELINIFFKKFNK